MEWNAFSRAAVGVVAVLALAGLSAGARAQALQVTPDRPTGIYDVGQAVRWQVEWQGEGDVPAPGEVEYVVKRDGLAEVETGKLALADGKAHVESVIAAPGTVLLEVRARPEGADKVVKGWGGAVAGADRIGPTLPRPEDFDAFWDAKREEVGRVPLEPELVPQPSGVEGVDYYHVTLDNIGGTKVRGQLARPTTAPAADGKLPAMLVVQWAGVYPLQKAWATRPAADGWLVLNVLAHDLPIDRPEAFYKEQAAGPLQDYAALGNDDREASYFLRMYLGCYQAARYLTTRDDWDGRTLVVTGESQGGQQALVTAALHPAVTAAMANVPAGCDLLGPEAGRSPGWPKWHFKTQGKDAAKVHAAARYFDVVNFAPRVTAPVLIGVGLADTTCPPTGILAAANQLRSPAEVVLLPVAGHNDAKGSHAPYHARRAAWLRAMRQGDPPPVRSE